jgi:DNA-binding NarL/FixJ family response regulator
MIHVAIFEDNKHLRTTFELMLQQSDDLVCAGSWADGNNVVKKLKGVTCDVVLMDIEMPGMNGIEATKFLKETYPDINILIQTVFNEDEYIFKAICYGASGYLLKNTSPAQYMDAIRDVYKGGSPMTPGIARRVLELFKDGLAPKTNPQPLYRLTDQEKNVLTLLVAGKSYKMIAVSLYVSIDTVKTHVKNIYAKLHVNSGTEAVVKAIQHRIVDLPFQTD